MEEGGDDGSRRGGEGRREERRVHGEKGERDA
jgi:hypothetical protein